MFPLAFKKHSAHVSFAGTPLQLQPWQKQSDCIIILSLYGMYHYSQPITTTDFADFVLVLS